MASFSAKNLLLVFLVMNTLIPNAFPLTLYDWDILIRNGSENQTLVTRCTTNGDAVGTRNLEPFEKQSFICHVLVRERSLASCDMSLGNNLHGHFDVYDSNRDGHRCSDKACFWNVNEDGLYLNINGQYILQYRWS